uniref:Arrestin_C domain-containing protein n=1 Tax=Caenorhabditis tropicalis TaxID=1561998 RepID=A0A1I7TA06_9PELO
MTTVDILFDKPDTPAFPGDIVTGSVMLNNTKPLNARSITVKWEGFTETNVAFAVSSNRINLLSGNDLIWSRGSEYNKLDVGTHLFPFRFTLPENCPPSVDCLAAKNEYKVSVEIDRPWKFNIKYEKKFQVSNKVDATTFKRSESTTKIFQTGFVFGDGPVTFSVKPPTRSLVPGQSMDLEIYVENMSAVPVDYIYATLGNQCHCHTRNQHHECKSFYWKNNCPMGFFQKSFRFRFVGKKVKLNINLAPYSEGSYILPFSIPKDASTPSFSTGLMTFGYLLDVGFKLNGHVIPYAASLTLCIGEHKDAEDVQETEKEAIEAPPAYMP